MKPILNVYVATLKSLIRDRAAFMLAVTVPVIFVLAFSLFDVSFLAPGMGPGIDYFDFVLPGLLAIGLMNFAMIGSAASLARYRELMVLKRISVTPLAPWKFIAGQVAARLTLAAVQTAVLMAVGVALGGSFGPNWPWLFVIALGGNLIFISLGFALAGRLQSVDAANNAAGLITTPLMFLSGSFFPIASMPGWLQPVAELLPLTPLVVALREMALSGASILEVGPELAIIGAWIAAGLMLARISFRFSGPKA